MKKLLIPLFTIIAVVSSLRAAELPANPVPVNGRLYIDPADVTLYWSATQDTPAPVYHYKLHFGTDQSQVADTGSSAAYQGDVPAAGPLSFDIGPLEYYQSYYWRVDTVLTDATVLHGAVWNFTTEYIDIPGTVIDYSPDPPTVYIGSPALAKLPDGTYVASHDFFGPGSTNSQSPIFESRDQGKTWKPISLISGQYWSSLFEHNGDLYIMGASSGYGNCVIRRSTDGGYTWTTPTSSTTGLLFADTGYHTAPVPVLIHNGRIWRAMEDNHDPGGWGYHFRSFMMSAPVNADLLNAANWTTTNRLSHDEANWTGTGWLEGNAVLDPQGSVVNVLRVGGVIETAAVVHISADGTTATFDPLNDFTHFYGGSVKFTIRYDQTSARYWSLVSKQADPSAVRNRLALVSSADMLNWQVEDMILEHPDTAYHAWQYIDWLFEGGDIIFVSRTAYDDGLGGLAHNYHDANFMTFHRLKNFRGPRIPVFDTQPADRKLGLGQTAIFTAAAHTQITAYQWFRQNPGADIELHDGADGGDISIVSTAEQTTLTIANVELGDFGNYYCVATNITGSATSRVAELVRGVRKMTAHWKLDETTVSPQGSNYGPVIENTGTYPDGVIWNYTAGMINREGPAGGTDRAYNFSLDSSFSGVDTFAPDVIPESDDFSLLLWFKTDNFHDVQGHLFSNNNGQDGRANVFIEDGKLTWWTRTGAVIPCSLRVDDNLWHRILITRSGDLWHFYLDENLVGSQTIYTTFDTTTNWMIGRGRKYMFDFEGLISEVRVYNYAVDEIPDLNNDVIVNLKDFALMADLWLQNDCAACLGADLNLDGRVDFQDLCLFVTDWLVTE